LIINPTEHVPDIEGYEGTGVASGGEPVESERDIVDWLINDGIRGNLSFVGGILGGGISYFVGLLGTYALFASTEGRSGAADEAVTVSDETIETFLLTLDEAPETFDSIAAFAGWIFYNAHGVAISVGNEGTINLAGLTELGLVPFALIPAVLLFGFGGLVALLKRADGLLGGFMSGGSVLLGYLPLAVAGALYFKISAGGTTLSVHLIPAILLAGIIFPLLFGGLAGLTKVLFINVFLGGIRARL